MKNTKNIFKILRVNYKIIEKNFMIFVKHLVDIAKKATLSCIAFLLGNAIATFFYLKNYYLKPNLYLILIIFALFLIVFGSIFYLFFKLKKTKIAGLFLILSLVILGFSTYSFSYLKLSYSSLLNFTNTQNIILEGYVSSDVRVIDKYMYFSFKPKYITIDESKKPLTYDERGDVLIRIQAAKIIKSPSYRQWIKFRGDLFSLNGYQRKENYYLGFSANVVALMKNISYTEYLPGYRNSWIWMLSNLFKDKLDSLLNHSLNEREKGLMYWLLFNNKDRISTYLKINRLDSNIISILINSKFYLIFTVLIFLFFSRTLGIKRKLLYLMAIPFLMSLGLGYNFSISFMRPMLVFVIYLLTGSHYRSVAISIFSLSISYLILSLFDPFIFTDKWFFYFSIMFLISTCFTRRVKIVLENMLRGWIMWILIVYLFSMQTMSIFSNFYKNEFFKTVFYTVIAILFVLAVLVQKKFAWKKFAFKDIPEKIKLFLSWIVTLYVFILIPLSVYYSTPVYTGHFIVNMLTILIFIIIVQIGYIGNLLGVGIYSFIGKFPLIKYTNLLNTSLKWIINKFDILIDKIEYLFPARIMHLFKSDISIFIIFYVLVLTIYYIYVFKDKIRHYLIETLDRFKKSKNYIKIPLIVIIPLFLVFIIIININNMQVKLFNDEVSRYIFIKTPKGKNIIFSNNLENMDDEILNNSDMLQLFLSKGIRKIDYWFFMNLKNDYRGFVKFKDISEYIPVKNIYFLGDKLEFHKNISFKEFIILNNLEINLNIRRLYAVMFEFFYENYVYSDDKEFDSSFNMVSRIKNNWNLVKNKKSNYVKLIKQKDNIIYSEGGDGALEILNMNNVLLIKYGVKRMCYAFNRAEITDEIFKFNRNDCWIYENEKILEKNYLRKLKSDESIILKYIKNRLIHSLKIFNTKFSGYKANGEIIINLKPSKLHINGRKI